MTAEAWCSSPRGVVLAAVKFPILLEYPAAATYDLA